MARKRKEDAQRTRTRILASALSLFAKKGYEHTTFTDIAARLKMTKGAVYWHFESKEALLIALVDEMLEKFSRQTEAIMPKDELTFQLMKCQIKWSDASMAKVREDLLANTQSGPMQAFRDAVKADIAAGRARPDVDAEEVAIVAIALWDGLVQSRIDHFLVRDLGQTLGHAYEAIWNRIKKEK